ncbi:helix-turn-helix domain-containing protein [Streptomyces sp. NBC_00669]|uniref:helix-turn-helix domain-containing protein n=1 Tax=Streptomyces sp. NBC_00669 TaxID=2976011 RepID=UPI002E319B49|nr:helix-turn-helix domain-containing protein [Streptomyces sp. NBC_00669]
MLTLHDLVAVPDFGLTLVSGDGGAEVEQVLVPADPDAEWGGTPMERALVVADPGRIGRPDRLARALAEGGAAGLVLAGTDAGTDAGTRVDPGIDPGTDPGFLPGTAGPSDEQPAATAENAVAAAVASAVAAAGVPVLAGPHPVAAWRELAPRVSAMGADAVRRGHARLAGLLDRLPVPGADERSTVRKLAGYLAEALDARVLVHADGEVLAAEPASAAAALVPLLGTPPGSRQPTAAGDFAQTVMLAPAGDAMLVVATAEPAPDRVLVAYTAKALRLAVAGLRERRVNGAVGDALRGVRLSAFQLFMTGHAVAAQRVVAGIEGSLMDSDTARVFILDCARAARDTVLAEAEHTLAEQALAIRCPAYRRHLIFLAPHRTSARAEEGLHRLMDTFADARVLLGGSLAHPLDDVPDAYGEALDCLTRAGRNPDRIAMATRSTGIVDVLAPDAALAWATHLLRPVLAMPRGGGQILETTAMAVEFEMSATARVIGVHRNTVTRRVRQVFDAVGLDQDAILDRVVLSLAAQIVARYGSADRGGRDADAGTVPDLHTLLSEPALRAWAEKVLRPLADDRRDLLRTVREWVRHGCRYEPAAASLGIAAKTVRSRIRAAEPLLERDLIGELPLVPGESEHRLASVRPLAVALYATTGPGIPRPPLPGGRA